MKKENLDKYSIASDNQNLQNEFVNESDRGAAIIGATLIEYQLERILSKRIIENKKCREELLESNHAFNTFSSKTLAAFCFGLISSDEYSDINYIREIRNQFAHHLFDCNFTNSRIKDLINNLRIVKKATNNADVENKRTLFIIEVYTLENILKARADSIEKVESPVEFLINGNLHFDKK